MAKPTSGEWIDDEFLGIARAGVKKVVSLLEAQEAYDVGLQDEEVHCKAHGMSYLSYPIRDRGLPDSVSEFSKMSHFLYQEIRSGCNVVIHCRAGIGRTGLMAAGILLRTGLTPVDAFDQVSTARGVSVPDTEEQQNWLIANQQPILTTVNG
ncbi:MAG: dual specificity protein phosphatase family protein [Pseudomonadota bacterium]